MNAEIVFDLLQIVLLDCTYVRACKYITRFIGSKHTEQCGPNVSLNLSLIAYDVLRSIFCSTVYLYVDVTLSYFFPPSPPAKYGYINSIRGTAKKIGIPGLNVKTFAVTGFLGNHSFLLEGVSHRPRGSRGSINFDRCQIFGVPTDRYQNSRNTACNVSIVVSDVTSVVHIRRQTAWNAPKASCWIQDIESANNTPPRKSL